jgi:predicted hotdog family 3-hydroxylacyl-ACP dehydratase
MADYIPDIKTLIPHGPPFVMVDRLLGTDRAVTRTSFRIRADNPLMANGRLGVAGLIENMAQTAAAGAGFAAFAAGGAVRDGAEPSSVVRSGAIVAINNLEITRLPALGEELFTAVTVTARVADIVVISGRITCGQSVVAAGEMKILTGI